MQEIKIEKYISESEESLTPLIDLLNTEGTHLVVAPTGAGKTNAIIEVCKELGKRNNKVLYVMACPNKVQNLQNANKYKIKSIVAGTTKEDLKGVSVVSMVYDKADMVLEYVKENNLNLVLIIDEAHQLVDSSMYRKKALQSLGNLKSYADTTILLTATPRKIEKLFKYDKKVKFVTKGNTNNFENHTLISISSNDSITHIANRLNNMLESDLKGNKALVFINDMERAKELKKALELQNKRVAIVCSDNSYEKISNDDEVNSYQVKTILQNNEKLSDNFNIFLATKVIEAGTNILNDDVTVINIIDKKSHLDFDSITQSFARTRKNNKNAFTFFIHKEEEEELGKEKVEFKAKPLTTIRREFKYKVNSHVKGIKAYIKAIKENIKLGLIEEEQGKKLIIAYLNHAGTSGKKVNLGCIEYDEELQEITINKNKLEKLIYEEYDKQFLNNIKALNCKLKQCIKSDNFYIVKAQDISSEEEKENLKEYQSEVKELREKEKVEIKTLLASILEAGETEKLEMYIKDKVTPYEMKDKFKLLEVEEKHLKAIKEAYKLNIEFETILKTIVSASTLTEFKNKCRQIDYLNKNKLEKDISKVGNISEYYIIRKKIDPLMKKQGRLSNVMLYELNKTLEYNKFYKKIKADNKKLPKKRINKLMGAIKEIYNITQDYKISSLK